MKITTDVVQSTAQELEEYTGNIWNYSDTYLCLWRYNKKLNSKKRYKPRDKNIDEILFNNLFPGQV